VEELEIVVREINGWDGSLDWLEAYENDEEFFEMFFTNAFDAVRSAHYGNYNYSDDLVRFDGYGNLESFDKWEYEEELKDNIDDIIEKLLSIYYEIDINEELTELIEEYLEEEEEE
jgi:hypothetical protein